jgi:hypothetical protein
MNSDAKFYQHHDCGCGNFKPEPGVHSADCCYNKPHLCKGCEASKRIIAAWQEAFHTVIESFAKANCETRAAMVEDGIGTEPD